MYISIVPHPHPHPPPQAMVMEAAVATEMEEVEMVVIIMAMEAVVATETGPGALPAAVAAATEEEAAGVELLKPLRHSSHRAPAKSFSFSSRPLQHLLPLQPCSWQTEWTIPKTNIP